MRQEEQMLRRLNSSAKLEKKSLTYAPLTNTNHTKYTVLDLWSF